MRRERSLQDVFRSHLMTLCIAATGAWILLSVAGSVACAQEFYVYYTVVWKAPRDGNFKAWWTKDGVRVTATPENPGGIPCVDTDVAKDQDVRFSITHKPGAINDHDWKFTAASQPSSTGKVTAYSLPDLGALFSSIRRAISWCCLWDPAGAGVDLQVTLEDWVPHSETNPIPEPGRLFLFLGGSCPDLPGYLVTSSETGLPFEGHLVVDGHMTLALEEFEAPPFLRGDSNGDGVLDISDAVFTLQFLFTGGAAPQCLDPLDTNDSGEVDISDPIAGLNFLFSDGPPPPSCYPVSGLDPTPDDLECAPPA